LFISSATSPNAPVSGVLEAAHRVRVAHVGRNGQDIGRAVPRGGPDGHGGFLQGARAKVGEADPQPERGQACRGREADPARRPGDDGNPTLGDRGMLAHAHGLLAGEAARPEHRAIAGAAAPCRLPACDDIVAEI
jgi:hypothetical protein